MEVSRKVEIFVATSRRYMVHRSPSVGRMNCAQCGELMLPADQAAGVFSIGQRRLFRIAESGGVHFSETPDLVMMICLNSLAGMLDGERNPDASAAG